MRRESAATSTRPWRILLLQDNAAAATVASRALEEASLPHVLSVASDAAQALKLLRDRTHAHPDLIFMDLSRPREDGQALLAGVKGDEALRQIPVLVVSASQAEDDVLTCYRMQANCYLLKPNGADESAALMRAVIDFWLGGRVLLPARPPVHRRER